jgi:hypothetical protein
MNDAFGDSLVVKVEDFFAEMEVFEERRPAGPDLQRVLIIGYRTALCRREHGCLTLRDLMKFAPFAAHQLLIVNLGRCAAVAR